MYIYKGRLPVGASAHSVAAVVVQLLHQPHGCSAYRFQTAAAAACPPGDAPVPHLPLPVPPMPLPSSEGGRGGGDTVGRRSCDIYIYIYVYTYNIDKSNKSPFRPKSFACLRLTDGPPPAYVPPVYLRHDMARRVGLVRMHARILASVRLRRRLFAAGLVHVRAPVCVGRCCLHPSLCARFALSIYLCTLIVCVPVWARVSPGGTSARRPLRVRRLMPCVCVFVHVYIYVCVCVCVCNDDRTDVRRRINRRRREESLRLVLPVGMHACIHVCLPACLLPP
eukprot:GHVU01096330.1.p1 GENE.GHVU01096330.1~~GHVU01096330.1.p1  ORF type:complete len:280 (+),score=12.01 GHVU01096330.1:145-984(+)